MPKKSYAVKRRRTSMRPPAEVFNPFNCHRESHHAWLGRTRCSICAFYRTQAAARAKRTTRAAARPPLAPASVVRLAARDQGLDYAAEVC